MFTKSPWPVVLVCLCFLEVAVFANTPNQVINIYQAAAPRPYTHRIYIRQIVDGNRYSDSWQRPARQAQGCEGPNRQRGQCVRMEDCVLKDIYQDYVKSKEYFCLLRNQQGVGVCCPNSITTPVRYREGLFTPPPVTNRPDNSGAIMFEQQRQTTAVPNIAPPPPLPMDEIFPLGDFRVCGRNGKKMSGITSAGVATVKDWPWMAAMIYRSSLKQFCGGTVITRRHILTAAHCFPREDPNEFLVVLGDHDLKRPDDSKSRVFSVAQMTLHEDFDTVTFENDIAILVINSTTAYNSFIQPCCLPPPLVRFTNTVAVVTGWGKLEFGGRSPNVLQEVPVPVWEQNVCVPNFAQTIFNTTLCAGAFEGGKDACQGDSGGPLVTQRKDNRWAIIGLVSWGIRCGEKNKPGVYTRVNDYLDWIAQTIL